MISMTLHRKKISELFDSLLIFLNCSASYSIIPYIIFHVYKRELFVLAIAVFNCLYLWRKYGKKIELPDNWLFYVFVILCVWNIYAGLFSDTGCLSALAYLLLNTSFFLLLYNLYQEYVDHYSTKKTMWLIIRGYVWLIIVCIIVVIISFVVLKMGYSYQSHPIDDKMDLFEDNVTNLGTNYYSIFRIGVAATSKTISLKIPLFDDFVKINGIYHEPHIITFMVFPCLFFMWAFTKGIIKKAEILFSGIFIVIIAQSTTNIIMALMCVLIGLLYSKKGKVLLIPIIGFILFIILIIGLENTELLFIANKLDDADGSLGYTLNELNFAFKPRTLVGSNMLNTAYTQNIGFNRDDIGYISFFLNIIFLIGCYVKLFKMIVYNNFSRMIGIGILYFFLHSIKITMVSYSLTITMLILFLLEYTIRKNTIKFPYDKVNRNSKE